jgi:formate hydrogenlyase subunit 6/NADH:ubiquinone oxidoreductase subunit I
METLKYTLSDNNLQMLLQELIRSERKVVAPVRTNNKVLFRQVANSSEVCSDHIQTALSAKDLLFPKTEELFKYRKIGKEVDMNDFSYNDIPETVLWGCRPCDAAGITPLNGIFNWDCSDNIFNERKARLTVVSFGCTRHDDSCFCTSVNGGPGNTTGSDILITSMGNGNHLAEIVTEKGRALVEKYNSLFDRNGLDVDKDAFLTKLDKAFDAGEIKKRLDAFFNSDIWQRQSARCLGCGACAYVCPACACFDIQDEKHGNKGRRVRCWDSCGFGLFTLHTSGHNPRATQARRWRQRLMHKFSYMPARLNVIGCSGCGRCSRTCPVDMNILEQLTTLTKVSHEQ